MFSRDFRRQEGAKSKHIFEIKEGRRGVEVVGCLPFGVSTGCRWSGSLMPRTCLNAGSGPLVACSLPFGRFAALFLMCWA